MAGKLDFDDTRDAIGVGGLSDAERKNMLKTFQDAGGQVLKEGFKKGFVWYSLYLEGIFESW